MGIYKVVTFLFLFKTIHSFAYGTPVITQNDYGKQMTEIEAIKNRLTINTDREKIRSACYKIIDEKYNPICQRKIISKVLKKDNVS